MPLPQHKAEEMVALVRRQYPNWTGFSNPEFLENEVTYKQSTIAKARDLLSEIELRRLVAEGEFDEFIARLEKIGKDNNLLWLRVPQQGDLSILYQPELDKPSFCGAVTDLLYGADLSEVRLARYVDYVEAHDLFNKWAFPTYFLFICHPDTEMFVKPRTMRWFLEFIGGPKLSFGAPVPEQYAAIKQAAHQLKEQLQAYGPQDMVDVQGLIWIASQAGSKKPPEAPSHTDAHQETPKKVESYMHVAAGKLAQAGYLTNLSGLMPPERVEARREGEIRARALLESKLGQFDESDLHQFLKDLSADWLNGKPRADRFMPALYGYHAGLMAEALPAFNAWTERIWQAADDELDAVLDEFWERLEVSGAGVSLPTALLYLRDPARYNIWLPVMSQGLELMTDFEPGRWRTAQAYRHYNAVIIDFREQHNLPPQALDALLWQVWKEHGSKLGEPNPEYSLARCADETGFDEEMLARWVRAIERKMQAILYGPPGTGKTYVAEHLARHLVGGGDGFWELVQFHPAYAYEDFIQGIRPQSRDGGGLDYPIVPGRFLEFCAQASQRNDTCVLIIDEINRANLARVFGELMYLLEYRDREIPLAGGGPFSPFSIPANVRIIGTMNTADRSIALVDHALRRRFAFLALYPDYEILRRYHQETGFPIDGLIQVLKQLNGQIGDRHYHVGITFFLLDDLDTYLEDIWKMEIEPYLDEYFFDQPEKAKAFRWEQVQSKVMP